MRTAVHRPSLGPMVAAMLVASTSISGCITTIPEKHSLGMVALQPTGLRFHILELYQQILAFCPPLQLSKWELGLKHLRRVLPGPTNLLQGKAKASERRDKGNLD